MPNLPHMSVYIRSIGRNNCPLACQVNLRIVESDSVEEADIFDLTGEACGDADKNNYRFSNVKSLFSRFVMMRTKYCC